MADKEHLKVINQGIEAWATWRKKNRQASYDLSGAGLETSDLKGVDFEAVNLKVAILNRADLTGANLRGANLTLAKLEGALLTKADLRNADLTAISMEGANLTEANLIGASIEGTANLKEVNLTAADLQGASLTGVVLSKGKLENASLIGTNLSNADLQLASLRKANLKGANLEGAVLKDANLEGADLRGTKLTGCDLRSASLSGVLVDTSTILDVGQEKTTRMERCIVDSYALNTMHEFGGLSPDQRAVVDIRNDLADLRASYSGLRLWIHIMALGAFLLPYVWFLVVNYTTARFAAIDGVETIALWEAFGRFIWNGGKNWRSGWEFDWSFVAFVFLAIYNFGRGVLLWQTNKLEHREQITNLATRFSLSVEPLWRRLIKTMSVLFWVGLLILAFNTYHFLSQKIPLG